MSPSSALAMRDTNFKNIDHISYLAAVTGKLSLEDNTNLYCVCGLPLGDNEEICDKC